MSRADRYFATDLSTRGATPTTVDVQSLGENRYLVTIGGEQHEVEASPVPGAALTLRLGATTYFTEFEEKGDQVGVLVKGQVNRFDIVDERASRMRAATANFEATGKQTITSPMPGKVVKVFVKVGDAVTEGQGLVVVEAMKMENELKSPKAGTVVEVTAKEGQTVDNGAKLLTVE